MDSSESAILTLGLFPEDLIIEILSYVPVKSLSRFKSVSKSWYSLIQKPNFIAKHLHRSTKYPQNQGLLILSQIQHFPPDQCPTEILLTLFVGKTLDFPSEVEFPPSVDKTLGDFTLIGPCNGIFCFSSKQGTGLWNPSIKEFRLLPQSCTVDELKYPVSQVGFGFDSKDNDYKVLDIRSRTVSSQTHCVVEIYSLRADSWKRIDTHFPNSVLNGWFPSRAFSNDVFYWVGSVDSMTDSITDPIYAFDMVDETFWEVPKPVILQNSWHRILIFPLHGSVALVAFKPNRVREEQCDIWVMEGSGNGADGDKVWTKLRTVGPFPGVVLPLGFSRNNELLLFDMHRGVIMFDDKVMESRGPIVHGNFPQVLYYEESMVSVNGARRE
ncbi:F-box domain [Dillenia turbinata]|uniref:F-box domain n=1 Tax=Dillenia turbinata TaxID=194707 RepID=A0AAN8VE25_9MAGN